MKCSMLSPSLRSPAARPASACSAGQSCCAASTCREALTTAGRFQLVMSKAQLVHRECHPAQLGSAHTAAEQGCA